LLIAHFTVFGEEFCSVEEECRCRRTYNASEPSVVVWATGGRLGNQISALKSLVETKTLLGMQVYMTRKLRNSLLIYFPNVADENVGIEAAEDILCGFEEYHYEVE